MFKRTRGSQEPVSLNWFIWATKKTRTAYGKHVGGQSAQNEKDLLKTSHASIYSEKKIQEIPANQKQELPMVAMLGFSNLDQLSIGAFYQISINLAKWF